MKSFLKAGVLTASGAREGTITGTSQGEILSPLLANIALSVLDDHFIEQWQAMMSTEQQRQKRRRHGLANYRLVRYADDFVVLVTGEKEHAQALREEVAAVLAPMGLRLSPEKTRVSTSTKASTSSASTSAGCANEEATSATSTPSPASRRSPRSTTGSGP